MNRHVPRSPERVDVVRVPPVAVEVSIGEVQQLADQVQERVESQVEEAQPDQMVRYLQKYTRNERACKKRKERKMGKNVWDYNGERAGHAREACAFIWGTSANESDFHLLCITGAMPRGEMFFTRCIVSRALIFVRSRAYNTRGAA